MELLGWLVTGWVTREKMMVLPVHVNRFPGGAIELDWLQGGKSLPTLSSADDR